MKKLLVASLALLSLTACSSNTIADHVTTVGDMGDVSIVDMRSAVVNRLLVAQTTFHNAASQVETGFYRCQFYDANQMQVGDAEVWQPVSIYPNENQVVKCMATQVEAITFKVEFSADGNNVSISKYQ